MMQSPAERKHRMSGPAVWRHVRRTPKGKEKEEGRRKERRGEKNKNKVAQLRKKCGKGDRGLWIMED